MRLIRTCICSERYLAPAPLHCDGEGCLARNAVVFPEHYGLEKAAPLSIAMERGPGGEVHLALIVAHPAR